MTPAHTGELAGALALIAVGGTLTQAALSPGSMLFGRTVIAGRDAAEIALTYDDGPNDAATMQLLEVLAKHEARATFFMIGRFVRQQPEIARAVLAAGHIVGNHTMTHPWLAFESARRIREELEGCNAALEDVLGAPVRFFRPPHGARRPVVLRMAREMGLAVVQWNVMGHDWKPVGGQEVLRQVEAGIRRTTGRGRGANVLLHDGYDQAMGADRSGTVQATEMLLGKLRGGAQRLVTVDAWV